MPLNTPYSEFLAAVKTGNPSEVEKLMPLPADFYNRREPTSYVSSLDIAAEAGHIEMVRYLVGKGADISTTTFTESNGILHKRTSALGHAAGKGHDAIINFLLDARASLNEGGQYEGTPLLDAVRGGHLNTVCLLLDRRANITIPDVYKKTPLHIAACNGDTLVYRNTPGEQWFHRPVSYPDILETLMAHGAPNEPPPGGVTPSQYAREHANAVATGREKGAPPSTPAEIYTPGKNLELAVEAGHIRISSEAYARAVDIASAAEAIERYQTQPPLLRRRPFFIDPVLDEPVKTLFLEGLVLQPIPGNGHCLFNAVALHLGQDQQTLRNRVADHLLTHIDEFRAWIEGVKPQDVTVEGYIESIRQREWADHLEIHVLNQVLNCQIIIFNHNGRLREGQDINFNIPYQRAPIFVLYNGHTHYDALLLQEGYSRENILARLRPAEEERVAPSPAPLLIDREGSSEVLIPAADQIQFTSGDDYCGVPLTPVFLGLSDKSGLDFQEKLKRQLERKQKLEWDGKVVEGCSWGAIFIVASLQSILSKTENLNQNVVLALGLMQLFFTLMIASARGITGHRKANVDGAIKTSIQEGTGRNYFLKPVRANRPLEIEDSEEALRQRFGLSG